MTLPPPLPALCVEVDVDTREMLGFYLRSLGLEVDLAANANEALRYSDKTHFDLYLIESWLPRLEGDERLPQCINLDRRLLVSHESSFATNGGRTPGISSDNPISPL